MILSLTGNLDIDKKILSLLDLKTIFNIYDIAPETRNFILQTFYITIKTHLNNKECIDYFLADILKFGDQDFVRAISVVYKEAFGCDILSELMDILEFDNMLMVNEYIKLMHGTIMIDYKHNLLDVFKTKLQHTRLEYEGCNDIFLRWTEMFNNILIAKITEYRLHYTLYREKLNTKFTDSIIELWYIYQDKIIFNTDDYNNKYPNILNICNMVKNFNYIKNL